MKTIGPTFMVFAICCLFLVALPQRGLAFAEQGGLGVLAESGVEGPIVVVDLVKYRPGGAAEYAIYDQIAEAKVVDLGGEVVFRGAAAQVGQLPSDEWDRVTFRKYPSAAAVLAMGSSEEYQGAFPHRTASVEASFVYAFSGELPSFAGANPGMHPMNVVPAPETNGTVYMLNLLRFKPDGAETKFFTEYGAPRDGFRPTPVLLLKGVTSVIADEVVDRLVLAHYPSAEVFIEMVTSAEYRAVAPLRIEAIELGLIWPFSMVVE